MKFSGPDIYVEEGLGAVLKTRHGVVTDRCLLTFVWGFRPLYLALDDVRVSKEKPPVQCYFRERLDSRSDAS